MKDGPTRASRSGIHDRGRSAGGHRAHSSSFNEPRSASDLGLRIQYDHRRSFATRCTRAHSDTRRMSTRCRSASARAAAVEERCSALVVEQAAAPGTSVGSDLVASPERSKTVYSLTGELELPISGAQGKYRGVDRAREWPRRCVQDKPRAFDQRHANGVHEVQCAERSVVARSTRRGPRFCCRGNCATGFDPPPLSSLRLPTSSTEFYPQLVDPERGNEPVGVITFVTGGDPNLSPERSLACGTGFVYSRGDVDGRIRVSTDYTWMRRTGVVLTPEDRFFADPNGHLKDPSNVLRAPREEGDAYQAGRIVAVYSPSRNIAKQTMESIDVAIDWDRRFGLGTVRFSTLAAFTPTFVRRQTPSSESPK